MDNDKKNLEIIPALNIYKGFPVIKEKDGYESMKNEKGEDLTINEILKELSSDFNKVLLTDINGINRDKPQLNTLNSISTKMEIWVDAGTRIGQGVIDIFVAGADYVVMGTKTLLGLDELEKANELSENVVLDINYDGGIVSPKKDIREMNPSDLAEKAKSLGIKTLIFTDLKSTTANSDFDVNSARQIIYRDLDIYFHARFKEGQEHFSKWDIKGLIKEVDTLL